MNRDDWAKVEGIPADTSTEPRRYNPGEPLTMASIKTHFEAAHYYEDEETYRQLTAQLGEPK